MNYPLKGLIYSLDQDISISDLKNNRFDNETYNFENLVIWLKENNIHISLYPEFHKKFMEIKNIPYIFYHKGNIGLLDRKIIGIVGPRRPSPYGIEVLEDLFKYLKTYDIVTISGMARGVDWNVHSLSIKYGIPTIAVLGGGLGFYLKSSERIFIEEICSNGGLILSEFKLKMKPTKYSFPMRNRIIAGICDFLILPEAGLKSGSLITADFALKGEKSVYGFPNSIYSATSTGLNQYISEGKIGAIYDIQSFLSSILNTSCDKRAGVNLYDKKYDLLTESERRILSIILAAETSEVSLEDIALNIDIEFEKLLSIISILEINGFIKQIIPGFYTKF